MKAAASLRWRLLVATLVLLLLALLPAGWALTALFRDHVHAQFQQGLQAQLDLLASRITFDPASQPAIDAAELTDPRWSRPFSGLYWQLDGPAQPGLLRSRSLWDSTLALPADLLPDGSVHAHAGTGPQGAPVLMLERSIHDARQPQARWRLVVASSTEALEAAVARFRGQLALSLGILFALLAAASWLQVRVGLAPLAALRSALDSLRTGRSAQLEGRFPREVQPLVDDFNAVLLRNAQVVERARQHAGNLAHAIKTPLAVLQQVGEQLAAPHDAADARMLGRQVAEQVALARRHVDWHLARSRSAGGLRPGAPAAAVAPALEGLVRVMQRVHAERALQFRIDTGPPGLAFQGEGQDLHEMLGNLLDNACQWARTTVSVRAAIDASAPTPRLRLEIGDDGPGIAPDLLAMLPARGMRLDESKPGTGLGLAIVRDLAQLYGGELELGVGAAGGLQAVLSLPAAPQG